jgi:hypothetical protein
MFLSRRQGNVLFLVLGTLLLAGVVSLTLALWWWRLDAGFLNRWLRAWLIAFVVATPSALLLLPGLRRVVDRFVA